MKKMIACGLILFLFACKKEWNSTRYTEDILKIESFLSTYEPALVKAADYHLLSTSPSPNRFYRVGMKGKEFGKSFMLLELDSSNNITAGKKIEMDYNQTLDGLLKTRQIGKAEEKMMKIENGFIGEVLPSRSSSFIASPIVEDGTSHWPPMLALMFPDPRSGVITTPEYSALYYINLRQAYDALPGRSNQYHLSGGEKKSPYGGGSGVYTSNISGYAEDIIVDLDIGYEDAPTVDVDEMVRCFNGIADQGAQCSITIFTDLPVNDRPDYLADRKQQYAGHCFLQLKKSNLGKSMTQHIGLYPKTSIKSLATTAPIPGRFLDDAHHGYNGLMTMNINFSQLSQVLQAIQKHKTDGLKYDVDDFNCTDFALKMFNLVRQTNPLKPITYDIPGAPTTVGGTNLPHGVYKELFRMKKISAADRPNITVSQTNLLSDASKSPCK